VGWLRSFGKIANDKPVVAAVNPILKPIVAQYDKSGLAF